MSESLRPCPLPWMTLGTNPFGKSRPCGQCSDKSKKALNQSSIIEEFNNPLFKKIRQDFLGGRWPSECQRCRYIEENSPGDSKKSEAEKDFADLEWSDLRATKVDGSVAHFPVRLDLRLGRTCNLRCIHCGTGNSSAWLNDVSLLDRYENTAAQTKSDDWINNSPHLWDEIWSNIDQVRYFNFLGGEPFASVRHKEFIERAITKGVADRLSLQYVTNGTLLTDALLRQLSQFKHVGISVSLDMPGRPGEFYRYPIQWAKFVDSMNLLAEFSKNYPNIQAKFNWTSSNLSMFYLSETLDFYVEQFPQFDFIMGDIVTYPKHMNSTNLPTSMKESIYKTLTPRLIKFPKIEFYLKHMMSEETWQSHGPTFLNYLDDLSQSRNLNWRESFRNFASHLSTDHNLFKQITSQA